MTSNLIIFSIFAYLVGSINFARIFTSLLKRELHKDKNPGATTVFQEISKPAGMFTAVFDAMKGFLPVIIFRFYFFANPFFAFIIGTFAIIGHCWPVYYRFKGGRGGATTIGVFLATLSWKVLLVMLLIYLFLSLILKLNLKTISLICLPFLLAAIWVISNNHLFYSYFFGVILIAIILILRNYDRFHINKKT